MKYSNYWMYFNCLKCSCYPTL